MLPRLRNRSSSYVLKREICVYCLRGECDSSSCELTSRAFGPAGPEIGAVEIRLQTLPKTNSILRRALRNSPQSKEAVNKWYQRHYFLTYLSMTDWYITGSVSIHLNLNKGHPTHYFTNLQWPIVSGWKLFSLIRDNIRHTELFTNPALSVAGHGTFFNSFSPSTSHPEITIFEDWKPTAKQTS